MMLWQMHVDLSRSQMCTAGQGFLSVALSPFRLLKYQFDPCLVVSAVVLLSIQEHYQNDQMHMVGAWVDLPPSKRCLVTSSCLLVVAHLSRLMVEMRPLKGGCVSNRNGVLCFVLCFICLIRILCLNNLTILDNT